MEQRTINVAIADDHALTRQGIKDMITSAGGYKVVIEAEDGLELIRHLQQSPELPDICILDIVMPNLNGYETLKELKKQWPELKILILSAYLEDYSLVEMLRNGANGYLEKRGNPRKLLIALYYIHNTGYYYSQTSSQKIMEIHGGRERLMPVITDREMEFLLQCCTELSYKEIADRMGISKRTVESYRDALFNKFDIKTRTGLAMFAVQNGIAPIKREPQKNKNNLN